MTRKLLTLFTLALFYVPVTKAQVSIENLLSAPFPTSLVGSADGKKIAWVFNDRGIRNIYVAEAPDFAARKITNYPKDDGQEISSLTFTPSADRIVFIRGGAPNNKNELPNPLALQDNISRSLWLVD